MPLTQNVILYPEETALDTWLSWKSSIGCVAGIPVRLMLAAAFVGVSRVSPRNEFIMANMATSGMVYRPGMGRWMGQRWNAS